VTELAVVAAALVVCVVGLVACVVWSHVRLLGERKTLLNAALSRSTNEFRVLEREPQNSVKLTRRTVTPEDPMDLAARVSAGMGDEPYRMPEGMNGG
jgi:hypothetical protein